MKEQRIYYGDTLFARKYTITSKGVVNNETNREMVLINTDNKGLRYVYLKVLKIDDDETVEVKRKFHIHRLLAYTYVRPNVEDIRKKRDKVLFIDNNKNNLSIDNLIWVNQKELNCIHTYREFGLVDFVKRMYDYNLSMEDMIRLVFDTKLERKCVIFKQHYIEKLISLYCKD